MEGVAHTCRPAPRTAAARCLSCDEAIRFGKHACKGALPAPKLVDAKEPIVALDLRNSQTRFPVDRLAPDSAGLVRRLNGSGGLTCGDDTLKRPVTAQCFVEKEGLTSTTLANRWTIKPFMGLSEAFQLQAIDSLWNECTVPKTYDRKIAPWISRAIQPGARTMRQTPTRTGTVVRLPTILHRRAVAIDPALRRGAIHVHVSGLPRRFGADAIASGGQIRIAPEAFDPRSVTGLRLIGHEIAHLAQQSRLGSCDAIACVIVKKNKKFRHGLVGVMPAAGAFCNNVYKVGTYLKKGWDGTLGQYRRMWADISWRNCKDGGPAARRACIELLGHKLCMLIHDYSDGGEVLMEKMKSV